MNEAVVTSTGSPDLPHDCGVQARGRLRTVMLSCICPPAVFTRISQPIFVLTILAKLTLVFELLTFVTLLHFCLSVYVVLLIPDSQISQQNFYIFPFRFLFFANTIGLI